MCQLEPPTGYQVRRGPSARVRTHPSGVPGTPRCVAPTVEGFLPDVDRYRRLQAGRRQLRSSLQGKRFEVVSFTHRNRPTERSYSRSGIMLECRISGAAA